MRWWLYKKVALLNMRITLAKKGISYKKPAVKRLALALVDAEVSRLKAEHRLSKQL